MARLATTWRDVYGVTHAVIRDQGSRHETALVSLCGVAHTLECSTWIHEKPQPPEVTCFVCLTREPGVQPVDARIGSCCN